jgi:hypothetical protein
VVPWRREAEGSTRGAGVMTAYINTDRAFGTGGGHFVLAGSYVNIDGGSTTFATTRCSCEKTERINYDYQ